MYDVHLFLVSQLSFLPLIQVVDSTYVRVNKFLIVDIFTKDFSMMHLRCRYFHVGTWRIVDIGCLLVFFLPHPSFVVCVWILVFLLRCGLLLLGMVSTVVVLKMILLWLYAIDWFRNEVFLCMSFWLLNVTSSNHNYNQIKRDRKSTRLNSSH